jgi:hypothetical protein
LPGRGVSNEEKKFYDDDTRFVVISFPN